MNTEILKTTLWPLHQELGAKFTAFAGYDMPINYGSQIEEHNMVRTDAGIFDVSHMSVIDITDEDGVSSLAFLAFLLSNDINKTVANKALYSCLCNEQGYILDDLIVYNLGNSKYRMVVNAGCKQKDYNWIMQQAKSFKVNIKQRNDLSILSVQGPNARRKTADCLPTNIVEHCLALQNFECYLDQKTDWFIGRTGYTGEDGFEIIMPNADVNTLWQKLVNNEIKPCGLGARDTLRLEAGMNLYGHDMDETTTPFEAGLAWTVAFEPSTRDFIGRAALEQEQQQRKQATTKTLMIGLILEERGVLREGQSVIIENYGEGIITSGTFSPTMQTGIAMARVNVNASLKNCKTCQVIIRNKPHQARIVKFPFVRNNQVVFKELQ